MYNVFQKLMSNQFFFLNKFLKLFIIRIDLQNKHHLIFAHKTLTEL